MVTDLPDYSRKVIVVYEGTITGGEVLCDHRKILGVALKTPATAQCLPVSIEHIVQIDHQQIKGLALKDPTVPLSVPISWEGPYLAYEPCLDAWKVKIVDWAVGTLPVSLSTLLNPHPVSLSTLLNPHPVSLSTLLNPHPVSLASIPNPSNLDVALSTRATGTLLNPHPVSLSTLLNPHPVSLASIPNPSNLDIAISLLARETTLTALSAKITNPLPVSLSTLLNPHPVSLSTLLNPHPVSLSTLLNPHPVTQTNETLLKATVTQADKNRTISSVDATATAVQISIAALNGNSSVLVDPAAGKAIRIKFISLEHSADVDIGYRFGAAGTIYYLRTTKGVYVSNLIGCNNQGAADADLYLYSSAATNVKGYILYSEV